MYSSYIDVYCGCLVNIFSHSLGSNMPEWPVCRAHNPEVPGSSFALTTI